MSGYLDAVLKRRSIYGISGQSTQADEALEESLAALITNLPTAFNMQGTRMVLLLGQAHHKLWDIVKQTLKKTVPPESFPRTENKLAGFDAGHGTVLFFNDETVTGQYMEENALYAANFPPWALQQNGMLQVSVWCLLAEQGLGASLQHYNPLIDDEVKQTFDLPQSWHLLAQMPFGVPTAPAAEKEFEPLATRFRVIRDV